MIVIIIKPVTNLKLSTVFTILIYIQMSARNVNEITNLAETLFRRRQCSCCAKDVGDMYHHGCLIYSGSRPL